MSESRGKAREIVVNANLTACYVLLRDLADLKDWDLDFSTVNQSPEQLEHVVLDFQSIQDPVSVSAGSIEILKLTTERTLLQFFFTKLPPVYVSAFAQGSPDFQETLNKLYGQIEAAMDAVATSVAERLQELKLFFWEN